jgi:membrane-associated protease RseP (regulator of RpoE activity)
MAKYYKVNVSLPYYIPMFLGFTSTIGTMGAFIRIKDKVTTRQQFFDIGYAGPIAGFIAALFVLYYGFTHLPNPDYIYKIYPNYAEHGLNYADVVYKENEGLNLSLGKNLVFTFFENYVVEDKSLIPNSYEMMHYPWLFAGFLALFFTALNLLPLGQLDGGHILFGMIGYKNYNKLMPIFFSIFIFFGGLGTITLMDDVSSLTFGIPLYLVFLFFLFSGLTESPLNRATYAVSVFTAQFLVNYFYPTLEGYSGWLVFGFVISRFLGIYHPPAFQDKPLDTKRMIIGVISLIIFIISFSPRPFMFS